MKSYCVSEHGEGYRFGDEAPLWTTRYLGNFGGEQGGREEDRHVCFGTNGPELRSTGRRRRRMPFLSWRRGQSASPSSHRDTAVFEAEDMSKKEIMEHLIFYCYRPAAALCEELLLAVCCMKLQRPA